MASSRSPLGSARCAAHLRGLYPEVGARDASGVGYRGTTPARRAEFAGHIAATERRFYEDHACGADSFYDDAAYLAKMNALANVIDELFNGEGHARGRKVGFVQMVFPFGEGPGRANYISNAVRADVVALLKEQLARFEGQADQKGST